LLVLLEIIAVRTSIWLDACALKISKLPEHATVIAAACSGSNFGCQYLSRRDAFVETQTDP